MFPKKIMKYKKIIIITLTAIVLVLLLVIYRNHKLAVLHKHNGIKADYVLLDQTDVVAVKRGNISSIVAFTGDLTPLNETVISSQIDAQVQKVFVKEGDFVKKSQTLAILDNAEVKEAVNKQQALLNTAKIKLALTKNTLDKNKELLDQGFISKLKFAELKTNYEAALETVNQEQATLYQTQKLLSDAMIHAPFSGYIYQKSIDSGQIVSKNSKLFALANLDSMQIRAAIPSEQINNIKLNQLVNFTVETNNQTYHGKITRINPVAEVGTRSYLIYIEFDNRAYKLKSGQFVEGQIVLDSLSNALYIPSDSIHIDNAQHTQYVLALSDSTIVYKPVRVLLSNKIDKQSAISGLAEHEEILSGDIVSIKPGSKAKIAD